MFIVSPVNTAIIKFSNFTRFDGETIKNEPDSNIDHKKTLSLGSYKGRPFLTGGTWTNTKKTEIFDFGSNKWELVDDYPFANFR